MDFCFHKKSKQLAPVHKCLKYFLEQNIFLKISSNFQFIWNTRSFITRMFCFKIRCSMFKSKSNWQHEVEVCTGRIFARSKGKISIRARSRLSKHSSSQSTWRRSKQPTDLASRACSVLQTSDFASLQWPSNIVR